ncbi:MAG: Lrp/AsnC family transcriptional regulator [Magnetococcales bacterium]|nr:Lrp/AsnC family transcriptional regulator [Magnetococcales bacterium]
MALLDSVSCRIINELQSGFPLSSAPFLEVAHQLDLTETALIQHIEKLLSGGYLTRFGPLFNAEKMGGGLTLAALSVPKERLDEVAERVNLFPEVAHNYAREHLLNMWFVLATETKEEIQQVIDQIESATNLQVFNLPKLTEYRLGFKLALHKDGSIDTVPFNNIEQPFERESTLSPTAQDRAIVTATQAGLPLLPSPFNAIAQQLGLTLETVLNRFETMLKQGWVRRIGVVPNHYQLGLRSNGMSVWHLPLDKIDHYGKQIGALPFVSHCYRRPQKLPEWPYNLFTMVHGQDRSVVSERVESISQLLGEDDLDHTILYSSRILKKTGLRLKRE